MQRAVLLLWLAILAAPVLAEEREDAASAGEAAGAASAATASRALRVLLVVVDGTEPVPRKLRHQENGGVTNAQWTDVSTLHHYVFERDTSLARLVEEMSFGQMTLRGDTIGMALPHAAADLDWTRWTALADAEALARGFDPASYDRLLYVLPHLPKGAPATGLSQGARGWCAFVDAIALDCLFHEFGHTLGMRHAGEIRPDGTTDGLGDDSDGLMGSGFNAHVNVVNKLLAGWLGGGRLATFDRTGTATFRIDAQSLPDGGVRAVRIVNNGARPGTGVVDTYVSFRGADGFDAQLLASLPDRNADRVARSVLIHQWRREFPGDTIYLRALQEGERYAEHGVSVDVLAVSRDRATIRVGRAPYQPLAPRVRVTPPYLRGVPGQLGLYTLSITNRNDPAAVSFDARYAVTLPSFATGWVVGWTVGQAKTVPPGGTRDFPFWVQAPRSTTPGSYAFDVRVSDEDGDAGPVDARAAATYSVLPAPGPPP